MSEIPNPDINLERTRQIVDLAAQQVGHTEDIPENAVVKQVWRQVRGNYDLPIYTYTHKLLDSGVEESVLSSLHKLLVDLKVDVSDQHASSSELSVIVGYLSKELLGKDISRFRRRVDRVRVHRLETEDSGFEMPREEVVYSNNDLQVYEALSELRSRERNFLLTKQNYVDISRERMETSNNTFMNLAKGRLLEIWDGLGVEEQSQAVLFFRDLKTYAGDVDFYYWGPNQKECTHELSLYLMSLGYKVDHRSNILVDSLIENRRAITNSFLGAYLHWYFFMGKVIEINGGSFQNQYDAYVSPLINTREAWPSVYKSVFRELVTMENVYAKEEDQYPGLKELPFRLLTGVSMGLSEKYGIPLTLDFENFLEKSGNFLTKEERAVLEETFYYTNHARSLYQLVTQRRWEMIGPDILDEIDKLITSQGGEDVSRTMNRCAVGLRDVCLNHFGIPENAEVQDLRQQQGLVSGILKETYKKVGERYKTLSLRKD